MLRLIRLFRRGLREKPRVALAVGLGIFAASAVYTFTRPKIYEATAEFVYPDRSQRMTENLPDGLPPIKRTRERRE